MNALTQPTAKTTLSPTAALPTPKSKSQKKASKIEEANAQIKAQAEEIERLKVELKEKSDKLIQIKETFSKAVLNHAKNTESNDVYHPTTDELMNYRSDTKSFIDIFKSLHVEINSLRENTQMTLKSLDKNSSILDFEQKLKEYDHQFELLKERYYDQKDSITTIINTLDKLIKSAQQLSLTTESKRAFSAIANIGLTKINQEEEIYQKALKNSQALYVDLTTLSTQIVVRLENTRDHLNGIDEYIHTLNKGALGTLQYYAGMGKQKTRTFDRNRNFNPPKEEVKSIPTLTEAKKEEPKI